MTDPHHAISADDWRRSFAHVRSTPNKVKAEIRAKLAALAIDNATLKSSVIVTRYATLESLRP